MNNYDRVTGKMQRFLIGVALVGGVAFVAGLAHGPSRAKAMAGGLMAVNYLVGLCLGAGFFLALHYITSSSWGVVFRRVPETMTRILPVVGGLTLVVLLGAIYCHLYPWTDEAHLDAILQEKTPWLNTGGFLFRAVIYFVIWTFLLSRISRNSRRQDESGDASLSESNVRWSSLFVVLFALSVFAASFDWIMSLEPHWFSTIFGAYNFMGMMLSALSMMAILAIGLERIGVYRGLLNAGHVHDLAKLIFAFSSCWAYLWFSQFMLIWYANIPEETVYFQGRHEGTWMVVSFLNVAVNWLIPFFVLISRSAKRKPRVVLNVAVLLLIGRMIDLYFMVMPAIEGSRDAPQLGLVDTLPTLGAVALFIVLFFRWFPVQAAIPKQDPLLSESLSHH